MRNSEHNGLFHREFVRNKVFVIVVLKAKSLEKFFDENFKGTIIPSYVHILEILRIILFQIFSKLLVTLCG